MEDLGGALVFPLLGMPLVFLASQPVLFVAALGDLDVLALLILLVAVGLMVLEVVLGWSVLLA